MASSFIESEWVGHGKEYGIAKIPEHAFGLDPCSDKLDLPAGRSGVISDKNAQNLKILSGQKWVVSGNFGIKHL